MRRACLWILLVACKSSSGGEDFPISPGGGGGGGGGGTPDAALDAPGDGVIDAATTLAGRVCVMTDFRDHSSCATSGFAGLTVSLGNQSTTTMEDGSFTITLPAGTNLTWRVTGGPIISSVVPYSAATRVPAVSGALYADLLMANGMFASDGQGAIHARVVQNSTPLAGATASTNPVAVYGPHYDGVSATTWDEDATSTFGIAWMSGVLVGSSTLTITPPLGTPTTTTVSVENQAITYVTIAIP